MPLATMASAAARTALSSTLPAKRFQLFQPMGGVSARFLSWAAKGSANAKQHPTTNRYPNILDFTFVLPFNLLPSQGKLQHAPGIVPRHLHAHPLAFAVVEGVAVVFVQQERGIAAGINRNGKRLIRFLLHILFDRTERQNRPGAHKERHGLKVNFAADFRSTLHALAAPEIVPSSTRKVDSARGSTLLDDRGDQHVPAPQVLVPAGDRLGLVGLMEPQRTQDGHACGGTFPYGAVEIRQQPVTQFQVFAADRLDLRIVKLARIGDGGTVVIVDLERSGIACIPAPWKAQLPVPAMGTEERAKCAELEPTQIQLRREFFSGHKSDDVRSPVWNDRERRIDGDGNVNLQSLPSGIDISRPQE